MKIPTRYTEEGEPITVVVTCDSCGNQTYDEAPEQCLGCGKYLIYDEGDN